MDFAKIVNKKSDLNAKEWAKTLLVKAVDLEKRQIRVLASTADLDRDGERVLPTAFNKHLGIFKSNPVILAAHQHKLDDGFPSVVGRAEKIWIDKGGLWCLIQFAETKLAEDYWHLYSEGFMKAVSIGFNPLKWRDDTENGKRVRVFEEVELYEISLVAVPANRLALSKSKNNKHNWLEEKKIVAEMRKENPNFDQECDEFAAALLGYKYVDGELVETDEFGFDIPDNKTIFANDDFDFGDVNQQREFDFEKEIDLRRSDINDDDNEFVLAVKGY